MQVCNERLKSKYTLVVSVWGLLLTDRHWLMGTLMEKSRAKSSAKTTEDVDRQKTNELLR